MNKVNEYIDQLSKEDKEVIIKLRNVISNSLPKGFEEEFAYGMISYVVPLSKYPKGYHAKIGTPLPFISIAAQKNHIAIYHLGIYGNKYLETWFVNEYEKKVKTKLDMGKSCIRFKNKNNIPYDLIKELCSKMTMAEYISIYEETRNDK